jgi:hypothetical protein
MERWQIRKLKVLHVCVRKMQSATTMRVYACLLESPTTRTLRIPNGTEDVLGTEDVEQWEFPSTGGGDAK